MLQCWESAECASIRSILCIKQRCSNHFSYMINDLVRNQNDYNKPNSVVSEVPPVLSRILFEPAPCPLPPCATFDELRWQNELYHSKIRAESAILLINAWPKIYSQIKLTTVSNLCWVLHVSIGSYANISRLDKDAWENYQRNLFQIA